MDKQYKYDKIAEYIINALEVKTLLYGDKLPSLRKISEQFKCSVSVALQAYRNLEIRGYVESREKSGYFAKHSVKVKLPTPEKDKHSLSAFKNKSTGLVYRVMKIGMDSTVLPLNCALPDPSIMPEAKLKQAIIKKSRNTSELLFGYTDANGNEDLCAEIAKRHFLRGINVSSEDIVVTNGCTEALSIAIQSVTLKGDIIAVETPVFFGIISLLEKLERKIIEVPTTAHSGLDLDILSSIAKKESVKACIFTANFQNPLGFIMPEGNKKQLLNIAGKYNFVLIEDDVYGECFFDGKFHPPLKQLDKSGCVIYCSSFSKSLAPGIRIGWAIPGKYLEDFKQLKYTTTLGGAQLVQEAVADYLRDGGFDHHLRNYRKKLYLQTKQIRSLIIANFPEGTKISNPEGGFFLWVELHQSIDAIELFEKALEKKVGIIPGTVFSIGNKYKNSIRISCAIPVTKKIIDGIRILGEIAESLRILR